MLKTQLEIAIEILDEALKSSHDETLRDKIAASLMYLREYKYFVERGED
jgi:hypothetical protein